ncbi:NUDIX hydrolase [Solidesulfovibrio fructosivorans JJ]]|uniref:NUDIX hydrolase n=1 Tax=Solidesulfovibrio fructosivorans JJ] TaxID=596151 RepID=E1K156_SOLFR|nr:NUDIX domain-containing protein [Solidesulfovibrio fructosivorans]EFL49683.1 NUDIX hydrolase [Solidesulfovibrio fructosivorans JJ]]
MVFDRGRVSLAVDCAVFGFAGEGLRVLAVRRGVPPFAGSWALPGGFVEAGETLLAAAGRELAEETGVAAARLIEVGCFDALDRDPRGRVVSVAFAGLVRREHLTLRATADAGEARWWDLSDRPALAFDHEAIVTAALEHVRAAMWERPLALELLGERFTLAEARAVYEAVAGAPFDVRNFRKRLLATGLVRPLDARETGVAHRAARYYARSRNAASGGRAG